MSLHHTILQFKQDSKDQYQFNNNKYTSASQNSVQMPQAETLPTKRLNNTHHCINFKINTRVLWLHLLNYPLRYSTWTWCLHLGKCFMLAAGATKLSEAEPSSCLNEPYVCTYGIIKSKILILDHGCELIGCHITGWLLNSTFRCFFRRGRNSAISPDISSEASSWAKQWI